MASTTSRHLSIARAAAATALIALAFPAAARGQDAAPPARPLGVAGVALFETSSIAAKDSFDAVLGTASLQGWGGGILVSNFWRGLFIRGGASTASKDGERVFIHNGETFKLGIPVEVKITPIEVIGGWRFDAPGRRVVPYGGGGVLAFKYEESSQFADSGENVNETFTGSVVLGGVEVAVYRWIRVGGELQYRIVSNALGAGGVSQTFGEDSLGGPVARLLILVGR